MKLLVIILGILCWFSCPKPEMVDASKVKWVGGRFESGRGTNYTIKLVAKKSSDKLVVDQLWIGGKYFVVKPQRQLKDLSITNEFDKKDTIFIQANLNFRPNEEGELKEIVTDTYVKPPYEFTGAALLGYTMKGKRMYLDIDSIKNQPTVLYP